MSNILLKSEQAKICEKYKSPVFFCGDGEKLGIALKSLTGSPVYGVRHPRENDHCGWYVWAGEYSDADDFFSAMHIEHIPEYIPFVEKYLALAPGFKFIIDSKGYEDVWYEPS
jgi:hypothetical protein